MPARWADFESDDDDFVIPLATQTAQVVSAQTPSAAAAREPSTQSARAISPANDEERATLTKAATNQIRARLECTEENKMRIEELKRFIGWKIHFALHLGALDAFLSNQRDAFKLVDGMVSMTPKDDTGEVARALFDLQWQS